MRYAASAGLFLILATPASAAESLYTDAQKGCANAGARGDPSHGSMSRCRGPAGYAVVFTDEGNVVDARFGPRGREKNLGGLQWSGGVAAKKVEWRMEKGRPVAAIFRVSRMNPETSVSTDYLAVAKLTPAGGCLLEMVDARASDANARARAIADEGAAGRDCALEGKR